MASKIKVTYQGFEIPVQVTFIGNRNRLNQYNQDVPYQEIRGLTNTSLWFENGAIVEIYGKEFKVTYLDKSTRPNKVTFSENVLGV